MGQPQAIGTSDRLSNLFQRYPLPADAVALAGPFKRDDRNCFVCSLPPDWSSEANGQSEIVLFEDGEQIGPRACSHDDVRSLGFGRFSHWDGALYFSASDNSNPNLNGRTYAIHPPKGWKGPLPSIDQSGEPLEATPMSTSELPKPRRIEIEIDPAAIIAGGGSRFCINVPEEWPSDSDGMSTLILHENDVPLAVPHAAHAEIDEGLCGRYSHWGSTVLFTTSDGSDPRSNDRRYVIVQAEVLRFAHAPRPPQHDSGECWTLQGLPPTWQEAVETGAKIVLLEDGRPLPYADAPHDQIRTIGRGRYSHWGDAIFFSTSDGTSPIKGPHSYAIVLDRPEA